MSRRFGAVVVLAVALSACGPKNVRLAEQKPATGLIYGQIVLPSDDYEMAHVMILKPGKVYVGRIGVPVHVLPDGRFVAENIEPGEYMLGGFQTGQVRHVFGEAALGYKFQLKPGAVHYLGSYRYLEVPRASLFDAPTFDLKKINDRKQQATLLAWLDESSANSGWQARIRRELDKYRQHLPKAVDAAATR